MISNSDSQRTGSGEPGTLRIGSRIAVVAAAIASVAGMVHIGRHAPLVLAVLFAGWVLSPFLAFLLAGIKSRGWSRAAQATLYIVTLIVSLASLAIYAGVAVTPPRPRPASTFLLVPLASWMLMLVVAAATAFKARRPTASSHN